MQGTDPKAIMITGAGQGIGRHFAERLAREGHRIAVVDVRADAAQAVAEAITATGAEALAIGIDITDEAAMATAVGDIAARLGGLDVLINNASIFSTLKMRPFYEIPVDEWRKVIDVNLTGGFICARHAFPVMRASGWGRIVNIASAVVPMGRANYLHYVASKAGVVGMTRAMARELGGFGITVNAILPGAVETEIERETVSPEQRVAFIAQRSLPRAQVPQDLGGVVSFLISEDAGFMTGQSLIVDGGMIFN
ncbi:SDR family oxidoreductase [Paracoccus subflavus]|uniref:SDR family oxidoreductase n=1 Tax=Paracoccus subflavus TaxID=2528244 RepID=A0A4Q9FWE8_9RHOB|nr:SDR family NAD(P)-dependent oxidoreductase [Paracoccus subflavus]TBN36358.1 SDR family oxidoreductase [Paracoccus subflavus]